MLNFRTDTSRGVNATLKAWLESPDQLLTPTHNAFGEELTPDSDAVLQAILRLKPDLDLAMVYIPDILRGLIGAFDRQLKKCMAGGDFNNPSEELIAATACAPAHNMASERSLGLTDSAYSKAPNAKCGFLSGKIKFRLNGRRMV